MTAVPIPFPLPGGPISQWQVNDWIVRSASSAPAAGGIARVDFDQLPTNELWLVDHATIACTSSTATTLRWYDSSVGPASLMDGSGVGNFDVGDWPAGLLVRPSTSLIAVWTGCTDGAVGSVRLQARQLRQMAG